MFELYVVTDRKASGGMSESETAELAYAGGADVVQLRMKDSTPEEMLEQAMIIKDISDRYMRLFIVNNNIDVAMISDADGIHLGQSDMPVKEARDLIGDEKLIGVTVHNVDEAVKAEREGADYVSIGSVFSTAVKSDAMQNLGLDAVFLVKQAVDIPVIAIGGINRGNIQDVIKAGADGVAVVSAAISQNDIPKAVHELRNLILKVRPNI
jgi:thiamine-phosphate pyrophosphorylase